MAAGSKGIRAGKAYVELSSDNSKLSAGLKAAQAKIAAFGTAVTAAGLGLFAAGAGIAAGLAAPVKMASDAAEATSKFRAVFGGMANEAGAWADDLAKRIGRSRYAVMDGMAAFQAFAVGLGFGQREAFELSKTMQSLGHDLASFHNLTDEDAIGRFISALSGSSEVLDRFGINTKVAALDQQLMAMGLAESALKATEAQKALARVAIIQKAMGMQGATGDAVRTADSFANRMKALKATASDASIAVGQALLPVLADLAGRMQRVAKITKEFVQQNAAMVRAVALAAGGLMAAGAALVTFGAALKLTAVTLGVVATTAGAVTAAVGMLATPLGLVTAAAVAGGIAWAKWSESGQRATAAVSSALQSFGADIKATWGGIRDAIQAGDLGAAAGVAAAAVRLQFAKLKVALSGVWRGIGDLAADAWQQMKLAAIQAALVVVDAMREVQSAIRAVMEQMAAFMKGMGAGVRAGFGAVGGAAGRSIATIEPAALAVPEDDPLIFEGTKQRLESLYRQEGLRQPSTQGRDQSLTDAEQAAAEAAKRFEEALQAARQSLASHNEALAVSAENLRSEAAAGVETAARSMRISTAGAFGANAGRLGGERNPNKRLEEQNELQIKLLKDIVRGITPSLSIVD